MSWRKGNPGSNHSTLWTRTALSLASLGWHHPHQPILRPATKVVFPKRKQEHTTPSAYNPWAALCCPMGKPILGLWWWVAACLSSPFPRPQPQLTLGSSPSMNFLPTPPHLGASLSLPRMPAPSSSAGLTPTQPSRLCLAVSPLRRER